MSIKKKQKYKRWQKPERWVTIGDFSNMPGGGVDMDRLLKALHL